MLWEIHWKHNKFLLHTDMSLEWGMPEDVLMLQVTV